MVAITESKDCRGPARIVDKDILIKDVETLAGDLLGKEYLEDLLALVVSRNGYCSVRFNLSHFIEHQGHLFDFVDSELSGNLSIEDLVCALEGTLDSLLLGAQSVEMD